MYERRGRPEKAGQIFYDWTTEFEEDDLEKKLTDESLLRVYKNYFVDWAKRNNVSLSISPFNQMLDYSFI